MTRYAITKKLPSCRVDLKMVRQLEKYLNQRLAKQLTDVLKEKGKEDLAFRYSVSIADKYGKEDFHSIEDYHLEQFPSQIKRLRIAFGSPFSDFNLVLSFGTDLLYSEIELDVSTENSKELAHGIIFEVEQMLKETQTIHSLFHGKFSFAVYAIFIMFFSTASLFLSSGRDIVAKGWLFIMLLCIIYAPLKFISPYTEFDTQRNSNINSMVKWVLNGLAGVFIFGAIASYLRTVLLKQ
jgi:ABC-type multidrug transport system permease subunit